MMPKIITSKDPKAKTVYRDNANGTYVGRSFPENRILKQGQIPKK